MSQNIIAYSFVLEYSKHFFLFWGGGSSLPLPAPLASAKNASFFLRAPNTET